MKIALIGLGTIGVPIAHRLNAHYTDDFYLIADNERKKKLSERKIYINGDLFSPSIVSDKEQSKMEPADLLIVCVKNYGLNNILRVINPFVCNKTVILPLQNGIYSYDFFRRYFKDNIILRGYVQGPNTEKTDRGFKYENPGELHIGSESFETVARDIVNVLDEAKIPVSFEIDIIKMVWKKWMLNIAGNSITALTGADYSLFKLYSNLQVLCRQAMTEFRTIAKEEGIDIEQKDIDDIIQYYVSYQGGKKTSMLVDVINESKTENDYLAGKALQLAKKHLIQAPIISTLYFLMEVKEEVYMEKKGCRATNLFTDGVDYSDALRIQLNDLNRKMTSIDYANMISSGKLTEQLCKILDYAVKHSDYYSQYSGYKSLQDFPVMNKAKLKLLFDIISVHAFDGIKTHRMYTSGSDGVPFEMVQDLAKRERNIADLKYFGKLAGYTDHDPMCYLRVRPGVSEDQQARDNIWQIDSSSLSEKNLTDYFHVIVEKKCTALIGYASTLEIAVDYWLRHFENETSVKTIISTSEALPDSTREKIKRFFGESAKVSARYSNSEQGILGQEEHIGEYTLNWASYYFEILKTDRDELASPGEVGRIVITDLYNKAFPMVRYDTGDTGRIIKRDGKLPVLVDLCGRRKMDTIYDVRGEPVSPFLLTRTMRHTQGVNQWQFIQESNGLYSLNVKHDDSTPPDLSSEIIEFKKTLGANAVINVNFTNEVFDNKEEKKLIISRISD